MRTTRMLENNCFGCRAKHSSQKRHEMEGGCLDTKPWGDIIDECFEDAVKGLYFCVDIPTVWMVLPVANSPVVDNASL